MRFMMIIKSDDNTENGIMPDPSIFEKMAAYNQELVDAGAMLAGEGLHPSSKGARVVSKGTDRKVIDGPFTEAKELVAGFWIIKADSLEEAVNWAKKCPSSDTEETVIEVRRIFEEDDFGDMIPESVVEQERQMRATLEERARQQ